MKTVRFSQVVKKAGKPSTYLQLVPAGKDRALKRAAAEERVMTVSQATVGQAADYGIVGLDAKVKGQVLVFPRSLATFQGKRVVGIKYELLEPPAIPKSALAAITSREERKKKTSGRKGSSKKRTAAERTKSAEAMLRAAAAASNDKSEEKTSSPRTRKKQPSKAASTSRRETAAAAHLRAGIRDALQALEDGESVKAYKLLQGLLDDEG